MVGIEKKNLISKIQNTYSKLYDKTFNMQNTQLRYQ